MWEGGGGGGGGGGDVAAGRGLVLGSKDVDVNNREALVAAVCLLEPSLLRLFQGAMKARLRALKVP
jgi:hypothetical protein